MLSQYYLAMLATLATGSLAAALQPRKPTCTFKLGYLHTQNPAVGGDNTFSCHATLDYGDGRKETVSEKCNEVGRDHCYASQLPYKICIVTNTDNTDGYLDYADKHRDFNEDGCSKDGWANPVGASNEVTCTFPCD
ncbi:uncharacterized protein BDW47DRAFT_126510 [Aspergillus candidus]|uniref:Uncharacterized protein n=1 Tax=Aspergillus candidus TaxID=41067 RepID=A0A2I2F9N0_ASPCN|nr:hypothetical protein BDW47DRAFT_126510 [Aspergillus candidus]PLB37315.1 hypothetical protein BDW47DRAFT_126510 [Aspergillus candidus]